MKTHYKFLFSITLCAILSFSSCSIQNAELTEDFDNYTAEKFDIANRTTECFTSYPLCAGQNNTYGEVIISNDATNLYVTYSSTKIIVDLHLWVGASYLDVPGNSPAPGKFPYKKEGLYDNSYTFTIPLANITGVNGCYTIIAHAAFEDGQTGYASNTCPITSRTWKNWAQYVQYCLKETCNVEVPVCDTGFGYDANKSKCFIDIQGLKGNRWGWVLGPLTADGNYVFPVYAGAGQCDLLKGTNVGTATVNINNSMVSVSFNIDPGYEFPEWHFNVSCSQTPTTTAPGQYNCNNGSCQVTCPDGIYVIIHTVTCK